MEIRKLNKYEHFPWNLLLLEDPSKELVLQYISQNGCYIGEKENKVVGVYVVLPINKSVVEIKNIAVAEDYQGRGFGKKLVLHAIDQAVKEGYKQIEVGTGNSSISQLALYQKCGFRIHRIERDFFIKNYDEPIYENGIQCQDMIQLRKEL